MSKISIVLAEDHHIVLQGLWVLPEAEADFYIVGEAVNGPKTAQLVEHLQPNVMIVDLMIDARSKRPRSYKAHSPANTSNQGHYPINAR